MASWCGLWGWVGGWVDGGGWVGARRGGGCVGGGLDLGLVSACELLCWGPAAKRRETRGGGSCIAVCARVRVRGAAARKEDKEEGGWVGKDRGRGMGGSRGVRITKEGRATPPRGLSSGGGSAPAERKTWGREEAWRAVEVGGRGGWRGGVEESGRNERMDEDQGFFFPRLTLD